MKSLLGELIEKELIKSKLTTSNIYDFSSNLTKCLLVHIERSLSTKESMKDYWALNTGNGSRQPQPVWSIEHIYPRNPKKDDIDEECEKLKDTLGNLTITAYNANLSNRSYIDKLGLEKNEKEINYLIKVKYSNAIFYDKGRGSLYNGYNFYADKEWTELALQSDVITQFGVEIHSSIGDNPYNRELSPEAKKNFGNNEGFNQRKELYEKAMQIPNVTQSFSY